MDQQQNLAESLSHNGHLLIYVIGCPGSGKGTLCKLLVQDHNCHHISVGDLLRNIKDEQAYKHTDLATHVEAGSLVPTAVIVEILERAITRTSATHRAILVDGFPRRLDQGVAAEERLGKPDLVLFFTCKEPIAMNRYLTRKLEGRLEDDETMFRRRYDEFQRLNPAVVDHFEAVGVIIAIDTSEETRISYERLNTALSSNEKWVGSMKASR